MYHLKHGTRIVYLMIRKTRKKTGSSMSSSEDGAPDVAPDAKLPSICPAVVINSLVSGTIFLSTGDV